MLLFEVCTADVLDDRLLGAKFPDKMGASLINTFIVVLPLLVALGEVAADGFHANDRNAGVDVRSVCIVLTAAGGWHGLDTVLIRSITVRVYHDGLTV